MGKIILAALAAVAAATSHPVQSPEKVAAWREDVSVARAEFLQKDASFTPERRTRAAERLDRLSENIPKLTDVEIHGELARIAALADNAHTRVYLLRNRGVWRRYPIRIWRFSDGWRVIAVRPGYEGLLGGRILRIGGASVTDASAQVRPLFAGVANWADYMASYSLTSADALLASGVIAGDGSAEFEVDTPLGPRVLSLPPGPPPERKVPEESWWFLSPRHVAAQGWVQVLQGRKLPAYLSEPNGWYSLRRCRSNILYLQFYRAEDQPPTTLAGFGASVLEELKKAPPSKLVIDLRFNTGGDLSKARPLFAALAQTELGRTRGKLYEIVGPATFSAAINHMVALKTQAGAITVGDAPWDRLDFWAEGGNVNLPNSKLVLHYADRAHLYSRHPPATPDDLVAARLPGGEATPDLPAQLSFAEYLASRDPATERLVKGGLDCPAGGERTGPLH